MPTICRSVLDQGAPVRLQKIDRSLHRWVSRKPDCFFFISPLPKNQSSPLKNQSYWVLSPNFHLLRHWLKHLLLHHCQWHKIREFYTPTLGSLGRRKASSIGRASCSTNHLRWGCQEGSNSFPASLETFHSSGNYSRIESHGSKTVLVSGRLVHSVFLSQFETVDPGFELFQSRKPCKLCTSLWHPMRVFSQRDPSTCSNLSRR